MGLYHLQTTMLKCMLSLAWFGIVYGTPKNFLVETQDPDMARVRPSSNQPTISRSEDVAALGKDYADGQTSAMDVADDRKDELDDAVENNGWFGYGKRVINNAIGHGKGVINKAIGYGKKVLDKSNGYGKGVLEKVFKDDKQEGLKNVDAIEDDKKEGLADDQILVLKTKAELDRMMEDKK